MFGNIPVTVIAQVKGKTTKENVTRNFAMMSPEGYRKTLRLIRQAEKFGRPVICIVDTPGAILRTGSRRARTGRSDRFKLI